jgi:uncharacterized membrane protein
MHIIFHMLNQIMPLFHIVNSTLALFFGFCIFLIAKGTRSHKFFGYGYVVSMALLNISAMFIYNLTGHIGPFHIAAMFSFITLVAGFLPAWRRKPAKLWLEYHYQFMCWCYAGLVAAAVSEVLTRLPSSPFWLAVAMASITIFIITGWLTSRFDPHDLAKNLKQVD